MRKRGQAAMEFLMTYGWALLVVLVAIGALAFFGVLNPGKFLPQTCILGPGLACEDFKVVSNAAEQKIYINVRNGLGVNLDVFAIYVGKSRVSSNEVCGGLMGMISAPNGASVTWSTYYSPFVDGTLRPLVSLSNEGGFFASGINCNTVLAGSIPPVQYNCCSLSVPLGDAVCHGPVIGGLQTSTCICSLSCTTSAPLPQKPGSKFNQDLVIVYREEGSSVLHQRIGRLVTSIE